MGLLAYRVNSSSHDSPVLLAAHGSKFRLFYLVKDRKLSLCQPNGRHGLPGPLGSSPHCAVALHTIVFIYNPSNNGIVTGIT